MLVGITFVTAQLNIQNHKQHTSHGNLTFDLQQTVHEQPFYREGILQHSKKLQVIKRHDRHTTSFIKKILTDNSTNGLLKPVHKRL